MLKNSVWYVKIITGETANMCYFQSGEFTFAHKNLMFQSVEFYWRMFRIYGILLCLTPTKLITKILWMCKPALKKFSSLLSKSQ